MDFNMRFFSLQARLERRGLRVFTPVPLAQSGRMPVPPGEPFLEGVRFLRAALQTIPGGHHARVVLVIPAGETTCAGDVARYLARSFAEAGKRTVFLPLGAGEGGQSGPGASDFLVSPGMRFSGIVSADKWDRVEMIWPGGRHLADASPDRVKDLLGQASERADNVIVYAGQGFLGQRRLLVALTANSDGVVLVADASQAGVKDVSGEANEIERGGGRVLGVALCRRRK